MDNDRTPVNMRAPAIPVLTEVVKRGAKAPPEASDEAIETDEPAKDAIDSEMPTEFPGDGRQSDSLSDDEFELNDEAADDEPTPHLPQDAFKLLDEATPTPGSHQAFEDTIDAAMQKLMPILESAAREALSEALREQQASQDEDDSTSN